jgi:hypothetical protein
MFYFFSDLFLLLCWVGVHCGIYKSSYNIPNTSYVNLPPPSFSFILPSPHSWNSFNSYHLSIYTHVYTVFALYSSSHTLSPPSPPSYCYQTPPPPPPDKTCSVLLFSNFVKEKNDIFVCLR